MTSRPAADGSVAAAIALAGCGVAWLVLLIVSVLATLGASTDGALAVTETAYGLPAVIFAALLAGVAVSQAVRRSADRWLGPAVVLRAVVTVACGGLVGAGAAAGVVVGDGRGGSAVAILGWALLAGGVTGGALVGLHRRAGVLAGAVAAAALVVAVLMTLRELFTATLLDLFGAGDTPASVLAAQSRLTWTAALLAGALAGVVAFGRLHLAVRRSGRPLPWPAYLIAGGGAGLLLLIAELITRVGGAQLLDLARSFSDSDDTFQALANAARINSALVVVFAGAFTALLCLGRTLPGRAAADGPVAGRPPGDQPAPERAMSDRAELDLGSR
ncbi:hypothetical protein ACN27F_23165 [Solwaraspora sp. WMMB335]|uniref:hypothetical protein n=1 Tax=Solwaraspora sp. WMMB335 TaxID=3404118 RepID=UPI003B95577E